MRCDNCICDKDNDPCPKKNQPPVVAVTDSLPANPPDFADIREWFLDKDTGLGLKAISRCAHLIQTRIAKLEPQKQRLATHPSPDKSRSATEWFHNTAKLQGNSLDIALGVVWKTCLLRVRSLLTLYRSGATSLDEMTLSPAVKVRFVDTLIAELSVESDLAQEVIDTFDDEEIAERPLAVEDFAASYDPAKQTISLAWRNPNPQDAALSVCILREDSKDTRDVYAGSAEQFTDKSIAEGEAYTYSAVVARQINANLTLESPAVQTPPVFCPGPVRKFGATFQRGVVKLSWASQPAMDGLCLYRAEGTSPSVTIGPQGPSCSGATQELLRNGHADSFDDPAVEPGQSYEYRIFFRYRDGTYSSPGNAGVTIPTAPDAPRDFEAMPTESQTISLTWQEPPGVTGADYLLVRQEGEVPITMPHAAAWSRELARPGYDDTDVSSGSWYTYSVFARQGDLISAHGANILVCAGSNAVVEQVDVSADSVRMLLTIPSGVDAVDMRRNDGPAFDAQTARPVNTPQQSGPVTDTGLLAGSLYTYGIRCRFRSDSGQSFYTSWTTVTAEPALEPGTIRTFTVRPTRDHKHLHCIVDIEGDGELWIYRLDRSPHVSPGQEVARDELANLGSAAHMGDAAGREWTDAHPTDSQSWYCPFVVSGARARAGEPVRRILLPPAKHLRVSRRGERAVATCQLPDGATGLDLYWVNPKTNKIISGGRLTAESFTNDGNQATFAPPVSGTYRCQVRATLGDQASGWIAKDLPWSGGLLRLRVHWSLENLDTRAAPTGLWVEYTIEDLDQPQAAVKPEQIEALSGLTLWASLSGVPVPNAIDWANQDSQIVGTFTFDPALQRQRVFVPQSVFAERYPANARIFLRMALRDPADAGFVMLIQQSNSCRPLHIDSWTFVSPTGDVPQFRPMPEQFICPTCEKRFPFQRMCGGFAGDANSCERITWRRRRLGFGARITEPVFPKSMRNQSGSKLVCKCPQGHDLPTLAHAKSDLMIGMIGARSSGKTHYITSALHELMGAPANKMDISLVPVNDTNDFRLQDKRILRDRKEAEQTLPRGEVPRYGYLTASSQLWGGAESRSVLMSFRDIGGEVFDDPAAFSRYTPYLSICAGLILVVDPLQIPEINAYLKGNGHAECLANLPPIIATPSSILQGAFNGFSQDPKISRSIFENGRLKVPLSIVLSKCDVLVEAGLLPDVVNSYWHRGEDHICGYHWPLHHEMTGMFTSFMQRYDPQACNLAREHFPHHAFFGVSATGCHSRIEHGATARTFPFIKPRRTLEPIWWQLARMKVIPSFER